MKTRQYLGLLSLGAVLLGATTPLQAAKPEAGNAMAGVLQVDVKLPPSWQASLNRDYVSELFSDRVATEFRRMGYEGKVKYVSELDERNPDDFRLTIQVIEWRLNAVGNVDCSFTVTLQTPRGERSLGVYAATALHSVTGRGRLWLGDSFEDAADRAIGNLYRDLADQELIPGLRESS